jgi:hypothetical protein
MGKWRSECSRGRGDLGMGRGGPQKEERGMGNGKRDRGRGNREDEWGRGGERGGERGWEREEERERGRILATLFFC